MLLPPSSPKVKLGDEKSVTLGIWDTAGAERFESLSRVYYHSARAAVVCFDASNASSFQKMKFWVSGGRGTLLPGQLHTRPCFPLIGVPSDHGV